MRLRSRGAVLTGAVVLALGVGVPAQAAPLVTLDKGHVDVVDVEYADGGFELHIHAEDEGAEYDPAEVRLLVPVNARTVVPTDPAYSFLGAPGKPVWILPQVQDPGLLFAGLSTEELEAGVLAGDQVTLSLCAVSGPGKVSLFTNDAVGTPSVVFNSRDGLPDATALPVGGHQHANWTFSAAGTYRFTFHVSARLAGSNQPVVSEPTTVTFKVLNS